MDHLRASNIVVDSARIRAFPFGEEITEFMASHDLIFVIEQNRDAQMKALLVNELQIDPAKIVSVLYYAGLSISADTIYQQIADYYDANKLSRLTEVQS